MTALLSKWRAIPLSGMQTLRTPLEISFCKASKTYNELHNFAIIRLHVSPGYRSRQFAHNSEDFINDLLRVTHGDFEMPPMECPQSSATCGAQPSRAKRGPAARSAAAAEGGRRRKAPGSRRRPPSLARASNKSTDASLLAATELVASKQPWSAGKRALHERDSKHILNMTNQTQGINIE